MSASERGRLQRRLFSAAALLVAATVAVTSSRAEKVAPAKKAVPMEKMAPAAPAVPMPTAPPTGRQAPAASAGDPAAKSPMAMLPDDDRPFDPTGRRDPFRPPRASAVTRTGEPPTPLQRYEIGQLKLVAIIYDTTQPRAVVEDDQGLGYIVRVGTAIGANGGRVRDIEKGRVLIEEDSVDFYGESHLSNVVMELRTAEGGKQ
jgi:type IV pilus assembly protein PilP